MVPAADADGRGSFEPPRALCIPDGRVSAFRTQWSETNCRHYDATVNPAGEHETTDARGEFARQCAQTHTYAYTCARKHTRTANTHNSASPASKIAFPLLDLRSTSMSSSFNSFLFQLIFFTFYIKFFQRITNRETSLLTRKKFHICSTAYISRCLLNVRKLIIDKAQRWIFRVKRDKT